MPLIGYGIGGIMSTWNIKQTSEFQDWFDGSSKKLQDAIVENVEVLRQLGPSLGRPKADTLKGSSIKNLKELRFSVGEKVIRVFYVFDPDRNGVLLIGGDKAGSGDKQFYDQMIHKSEKIYASYLEERKKAIEEEQKKLAKTTKKKTSKKTTKRKKK